MGPAIHFVDQTGLILRDRPVSASWVLGLKCSGLVYKPGWLCLGNPAFTSQGARSQCVLQPRSCFSSLLDHNL